MGLQRPCVNRPLTYNDYLPWFPWPEHGYRVWLWSSGEEQLRRGPAVGLLAVGVVVVAVGGETRRLGVRSMYMARTALCTRASRDRRLRGRRR